MKIIITKDAQFNKWFGKNAWKFLSKFKVQLPPSVKVAKEVLIRNNKQNERYLERLAEEFNNRGYGKRNQRSRAEASNEFVASRRDTLVKLPFDPNILKNPLFLSLSPPKGRVEVHTKELLHQKYLLSWHYKICSFFNRVFNSEVN